MFKSTLFQIKKSIWNTWQRLRGEDRAYAKYLAHFAHYQSQVVDSELQQSLNIQPMSKEAFVAAWQQNTLKPADKSCGCKTGGCG